MASNVALIAAAGRPGNFFFSTSIRPTLLKSLPAISCLNAGMSASGICLLGLASLCGLFGGLVADWDCSWSWEGCCCWVFRVEGEDRRPETGVKKGLTVLVPVIELALPLVFRELFFIVWRGMRGGSIAEIADEVQYAAENGLILLIVGSADNY